MVQNIFILFLSRRESGQGEGQEPQEEPARPAQPDRQGQVQDPEEEHPASNRL